VKNLIRAMREVFPTLDEAQLVPALRLCDCPNWDSMTAVNLMMEVEAACGVTLGEYNPPDGVTLGDLVGVVAAAGGTP
jgi:hypothetical protein